MNSAICCDARLRWLLRLRQYRTLQSNLNPTIPKTGWAIEWCGWSLWMSHFATLFSAILKLNTRVVCIKTVLSFISFSALFSMLVLLELWLAAAVAEPDTCRERTVYVRLQYVLWHTEKKGSPFEGNAVPSHFISFHQCCCSCSLYPHEVIAIAQRLQLVVNKDVSTPLFMVCCWLYPHSLQQFGQASAL